MRARLVPSIVFFATPLACGTLSAPPEETPMSAADAGGEAGPTPSDAGADSEPTDAPSPVTACQGTVAGFDQGPSASGWTDVTNGGGTLSFVSNGRTGGALHTSVGVGGQAFLSRSVDQATEHGDPWTVCLSFAMRIDATPTANWVGPRILTWDGSDNSLFQALQFFVTPTGLELQQADHGSCPAGRTCTESVTNLGAFAPGVWHDVQLAFTSTTTPGGQIVIDVDHVAYSTSFTVALVPHEHGEIRVGTDASGTAAAIDFDDLVLSP